MLAKNSNINDATLHDAYIIIVVIIIIIIIIVVTTIIFRRP